MPEQQITASDLLAVSKSLCRWLPRVVGLNEFRGNRNFFSRIVPEKRQAEPFVFLSFLHKNIIILVCVFAAAKRCRLVLWGILLLMKSSGILKRLSTLKAMRVSESLCRRVWRRVRLLKSFLISSTLFAFPTESIRIVAIFELYPVARPQSFRLSSQRRRSDTSRYQLISSQFGRLQSEQSLDSELPILQSHLSSDQSR